MDIKLLDNSPNIKSPAAANVCRDSIANEDSEWNRKRLAKNARKRERRQKLKSENPTEYQEKVSAESVQRRERRQKQNPEIHSAFLDSEKQKREILKRETLNDLFDSLFEENKHTFPTPVSKTLWQTLKKSEIDYLFSKHFSPGEITIPFLHSYRQEQLDFLKNNPNFPHGGSVIFYIKTMVHRAKDQRIITPEELDYIHSLILPEKDSSKVSKRREYYEKNQKTEIERAKSSYETKKSDQKTYNLNIRFMKEDPNRVLSIDDICHNPFVSNFSRREEYKIHLWKMDKNPEYLEKWKKQRDIYEKEVADLSIEYKINFLKNKWLAQS